MDECFIIATTEVAVKYHSHAALFTLSSVKHVSWQLIPKKIATGLGNIAN